jgi:hypothetical protein
LKNSALHTNKELALLDFAKSKVKKNEYYEFFSISFDNVFIRIADAISLKETLLKEKEELEGAEPENDPNSLINGKVTKQTLRERIFLTWLSDKDFESVSDMKKEDVWTELHKLDHSLFSVEPKNFFRDQKIITFKSGRK